VNAQRNQTEEGTRFAVSCAVGVKAPNTATHMRVGKEFPSAVVRRKTLLVDIIIYKVEIKMESQQTTRASTNTGVGGQSILDIGK
jgi:hypothetical protein